MKFFVFIIFLSFAFVAQAKPDKKNTSKSFTKAATTKNTAAPKSRPINKPVQDELMSNMSVNDCYNKTDFGRQKKTARFVIDVSVDRLGEVTERRLNTKLSTVENAEITNCLMGVLSSLIIPFKSSERNRTVAITFDFPHNLKKRKKTK